MKPVSNLNRSVSNDPSRRNFESSPAWRSLQLRLESYAELVAFARKQDLFAVDGFSRRASERTRMQAELRRLDTLAHRASFPRVAR
jgi:hypothetical protein